MRIFVLLLLLSSCNRYTLVPLALFSTPNTKPLVSIAPIVNRDEGPLGNETAAIITFSVIERLTQKNRMMMEDRYPQFAVKMQLVECETPSFDPSKLSMCLHLEILDLRTEKSKVILQEVLSSTTLIPQGQLEVDWNSPAFRMSPLGLAHRKLSREIATRIEDYILLAQKGSIG